jgi:hypothetical protein
MSQLLPTAQARRARESLTEYLRTTFALADTEVQTALDQFLSDPDTGIFKGPFVRTRTPFKPQPGGGDALEITPGKFEPYGHQARAFERLSSRRLGEGTAAAADFGDNGHGIRQNRIIPLPDPRPCGPPPATRRGRSQRAHPVPDERSGH